jgi:hypothetical protein
MTNCSTRMRCRPNAAVLGVPLFTPTKQTHHAKASDEERESGWDRSDGRTNREITVMVSPTFPPAPSQLMNRLFPEA